MLKLIKNLWSPEIKENAIAASIKFSESPAGTWWKQ